MSDLWLGASVEEAKYVFLLPNKPVLSESSSDTVSIVENVPTLIEVNGNHWRKIFTIMAKLIVPDLAHWREFRDNGLLDKVGVAFSEQQLRGYQGVVFVVGNTFRENYPIPKAAKLIGANHIAYVLFPYIWCPYLDYRQFPNVLIESLRESLLEK